jgi:hypothetical protein
VKLAHRRDLLRALGLRDVARACETPRKSPKRQSRSSAERNDVKTTPAGRPSSMSSSSGWMNGENDTVGQTQATGDTHQLGAAEPSEQRVTATVRAWVEEPLDRGPDPPQRRAERMRTVRRAVVRYVALQFDKPVLDVDCGAATGANGLSVHMDRQHAERIIVPDQFQQHFVVEVRGSQLTHDHEVLPMSGWY